MEQLTMTANYKCKRCKKGKAIFTVSQHGIVLCEDCFYEVFGSKEPRQEKPTEASLLKAAAGGQGLNRWRI